jgi:hypothetical protein
MLLATEWYVGLLTDFYIRVLATIVQPPPVSPVGNLSHGTATWDKLLITVLSLQTMQHSRWCPAAQWAREP